MPIAYLGGVSMVIVFYVLIAIVAVGHISDAEIAGVESHALSAVA